MVKNKLVYLVVKCTISYIFTQSSIDCNYLKYEEIPPGV